MGKKSTERRIYTKEFKAEAVALAQKGEKPISQIAKDLGSTTGCYTDGCTIPGKQLGAACKHSPAMDGRGMRNWSAYGKRTRR